MFKRYIDAKRKYIATKRGCQNGGENSTSEQEWFPERESKTKYILVDTFNVLKTQMSQATVRYITDNSVQASQILAVNIMSKMSQLEGYDTQIHLISDPPVRETDLEGLYTVYAETKDIILREHPHIPIWIHKTTMITTPELQSRMNQYNECKYEGAPKSDPIQYCGGYKSAEYDARCFNLCHAMTSPADMKIKKMMNRIYNCYNDWKHAQIQIISNDSFEDSVFIQEAVLRDSNTPMEIHPDETYTTM